MHEMANRCILSAGCTGTNFMFFTTSFSDVAITKLKVKTAFNIFVHTNTIHSITYHLLMNWKLMSPEELYLKLFDNF
jgi:hypothetical protein